VLSRSIVGVERAFDRRLGVYLKTLVAGHRVS